MSATSETVRRLTVGDIAKLHADGQQIAMLTAYDYPTAKLLDEAGIPLLLVGDSLGRAMLGYENEITVSMADMLHHTAAVTRGARRAFVIGDMPFLSLRHARGGRRQRRPLPVGGRRAGRQARGWRANGTDDRGDRQGRHSDDGSHRLDAAGRQRRRQGPGPRQEPRTGPIPPPRRAGGPGGGRLRDRPRARAGAARPGHHGSAADPDDRDRGGRRVQRPGPGDHGPARDRDVASEARQAVRGPARNDPRRPRRRGPTTSPPAHSRDRSRRSAWTTTSSTRSSAAASTTAATGTDMIPGGIPLDRDL